MTDHNVGVYQVCFSMYIVCTCVGIRCIYFLSVYTTMHILLMHKHINCMRIIWHATDSDYVALMQCMMCFRLWVNSQMKMDTLPFAGLVVKLQNTVGFYLPIEEQSMGRQSAFDCVDCQPCKPCPEGALCDYNQITAKPGYWRQVCKRDPIYPLISRAPYNMFSTVEHPLIWELHQFRVTVCVQGRNQACSRVM